LHDKKATRVPKAITATLAGLTLCALGSAWLTIKCVLIGDPDLRILVGVLAFAALLTTLMIGIRAGKAINRVPSASPWLRVLGVVLVFPLAIFGAIIICAGLVMLFVSVRQIEMDACSGHLAGLAAVRFFVALLMPLGGYGMLRQGLRRDPKVIEVVHHGSREVTIVSVPLWFRVSMLADGIAIGTSFLAFAVLSSATTCEAAAWIWSPRISIFIVTAAAALAVRIFALRRRRPPRGKVSW
jgi:hypothetical protein